MTNSNPESPLKALLEASVNSPLSEAEPNSLDELMERVRTTFNTKPLDLSDADIASNVKYYILKGAQFALLSKEKFESDQTKGKRTRNTNKNKTQASITQASIDAIEL